MAFHNRAFSVLTSLSENIALYIVLISSDLIEMCAAVSRDLQLLARSSEAARVMGTGYDLAKEDRDSDDEQGRLNAWIR